MIINLLRKIIELKMANTMSTGKPGTFFLTCFVWRLEHGGTDVFYTIVTKAATIQG